MLVAERAARCGSSWRKERLDVARGAAPDRPAVIIRRVMPHARRGVDGASRISGRACADGHFALAASNSRVFGEKRTDGRAEIELVRAMDAVRYVDAALDSPGSGGRPKRLEASSRCGLLQGDPSTSRSCCFCRALLDLGRQDDAAIARERILGADPAHAGAIYTRA